MMPQRFHQNAEVGQQLYAVIEYCRKPASLWSKLATGHYDWLGVRRNGRFVLGRPRLTAAHVEEHPADRGDAPPHRVEYRAPLDRAYRWEPHPTADDARAAFDCIVTGDPVTPLRSSGIWRVRLVVDDEPTEERLVVRTLPIVS